MSRDSNGELSFDFQLTIWDAVWLGHDASAVTDAALVEFGLTDWDHDKEYLESMELHIGDRKVPTPSYWALPAVTQLLLLDEELADQTLARQ